MRNLLNLVPRAFPFEISKEKALGTRLEFTKTIIPFALVGYEVIIINSRYALLGYFITSYPTRAHGIIVI